MLIVISPSKTLDFKGRSNPEHTIPFFKPQISQLLDHMKTLSAKDLELLMKISPKLADLNHDRYQRFQLPLTPDNSRQALLAFKGDVYQGIQVDNYSDSDIQFAQGHLRILSGLYGLLRPLDLIQPYRLEMGTRLSGPWGKNLYDFWADAITDRINQELEQSKGENILINLASNEYFKAIQPGHLNTPVLHIHFKEKMNHTLKVIGIHAKRARGLMADFIIKHQIRNPEKLKTFTRGGYEWNPAHSCDTEWIFARG
ncbi:MAG: peroxide stress protein YaaA [Desulfotignum sp.]|nr:peroxide stress protein YaaA [Desulfotignum sp.]